MADIPFFRGFNRYDLYTAAMAGQAITWGSPGDALTVLNGVEPAIGSLIVQEREAPAAVASFTRNFCFVAIAGTTTWAQWVLNVLGSPQAEFPNIPGGIAFTFGVQAEVLERELISFFATRLQFRRLVIIGHSLGGAVGQVLLPLLQPVGPIDSAAWALGSPRVGNPAFAAAVGPNVHRIESTEDPIVGVPPELWAGTGSHFPIPGFPPFAMYTHAGDVQTVDSAGQLTDGGNGVTFNDVVAAFTSWEAPTHYPNVYVSRLSAGLQLYPIPPEVGYAQPSQIVSVDRLLNTSPAMQGENEMPYLTEATMFFRANNGVVEGWAESVYFSSDVNAALALIQATLIPNRTMTLSNQVEIHAVRAARADGTRASLAKKLDSPVPGQVSLPVNEFGDCINIAIDSADGQRRIYNFRGIPDDWTAGQNLTPGGRDGLAKMLAYMTTLKNAGAALKIPFGGNPFLPISIIANNPLAGGPIQVTTLTPSGVTQNTLVTIRGLRGYPYLRGNWRANAVDSLNFKLVGSQRYAIDLAVNTGEVRIDEYVASSISSWAYSGIGFRKTGRPFGQPRGKQSKRLLRS